MACFPNEICQEIISLTIRICKIQYVLSIVYSSSQRKLWEYA
jgi:hypothetical protein